MRLRLLGAGVALCLVGGASPGTAAAPTPQPVGGTLLTGSATIVHPEAGAPSLPAVTAGAWIVADADTGEILAAKGPHERYLPASTLKTLTAVTLIPRLDPDTMVKTTYGAAAVEGSKVGIVPGMSYSVDKLMTAMMVVSGNDAANSLAHAAGGMKRTVRLMNEKARYLRAYDTVAKTPSGLDAPGESTSVYDLALIGRAGLEMPDFRRYVGTVKSTMPAPRNKHFEIYTHNRLLTTFRGDIGIKNGYTVAAGASYIGAATRNGHTIIIAMLHAQPYFWDEARSLLSWGFRARGHVLPIGRLVEPGEATVVKVSSDDEGPADDTSGTTVVLAAHNGSTFPVWQVIALAFSAAVAIVVTARRQRRRYSSRMSLPPI
jgi:serine-type D-Ala-D-Ala carboxypeptidase (penicillin-binding protein 5/6)